MANKATYISGLDLGSSKTCALVCFPGEDGKLQVAGFGSSESKGWRKGVIVSLDAAVLSIKKAVEAAEEMAGVPIDSAYVGVSGPHVTGRSSQASVMLAKAGRTSAEVTREDVRRVFATAQSITLPPDRKLICAERQEYGLDGQGGIRNPVGMVGSKLDVNVHLITASTIAHDNVVAAANQAGVYVHDTIFEAMAAADACLTADEKELGVALLDIGAGASNLIVYREGSVRHSSVIPVGGEHFTNDVAVGLRTPIPEAEKLKIAWAGHEEDDSTENMLEVASVGERPSRTVTSTMLKDILEPRAMELLEMVEEELARAGLEKQMASGLVLTGGGAKLGGLMAMAEKRLEVPVRLGLPAGLQKMGDQLPDPAYTTLAGLVIHGNRLRLLQGEKESSWIARILGIRRAKEA